MTAAVTGTAWQGLLRETSERIGDLTEARWLLEEVSGYSWPELSAPRGTAISVGERAKTRLEAMVRRRLAGEPIQYVLGRWQFRSLDLMVDPRVLIPRPETEFVVEVALEEMERLPTGPGAGAGEQPGAGRGEQIVVDLGTGSGAIALSFAAERSRTRVFATDASPEALKVAAANLAGLGGRAAQRVRLNQGDWWSALPPEIAGRVDLVVCNPPYISTKEMHCLDPSVREWEPREALESGPTGLEAVEAVLDGAGGWLTPGGTAVLEIAPHQADTAVELASKVGFAEAVVFDDLAGRARALVARGAP